MIVNELDPRHGHCSVTIESAEDLWTLRRLIAKGDTIVTKSSRVVKHEDEYSRPDKGERVKVTVSLVVEDIHLDSSIERVRVKGKIVEASDESVTKSGSHAVTLSPGHSVVVRKERWGPLDTSLLKEGQRASERYLVVAVDRREAGVGTMSGSHLALLTTLESGLGGKMSEEQSARPYLSRLAGSVSQSYREGDRVVVAGPGAFKNSVANELRERLGRAQVSVVEGLDDAGADGVRALPKNKSFQELAKDSLVVELQRFVAEAVRRISSGDPKVAYTLQRVRDAAAAGSVEACAVSDDVFSMGAGEEDLVEVMNSIETKGGKVYLADSSVESGKQVSSFGGMVALLRYAVRA